MQLIFSPDGAIVSIYTEDLNLGKLGDLTHIRASHVEPTDTGDWTADLSPVNGPVLGPFTKRSDALHAENEWVEEHLEEIAL